MINRYAVVLAAGQGTRMKSSLYKVLHPVCGKPMVQHVIDQLNELEVTKIVTVIGHGAEKVKESLSGNTTFVLQEKQLGTAHAVMQAESEIGSSEGLTLVVCGDSPLIQAETIRKLMEEHEKAKAKVTVLTAKAEDPTGYGRIIRDAIGNLERIVEQKDASAEEKAVQEINTGVFCFDNRTLFEALKEVNNNNAQGEYYLPDVIEIIRKKGEIVTACQAASFEEALGVNDRVALSKAESLMRKRINEKHMRNGVTIIDPDHTYISADSVIGRDTVLYPGTIISGKSEIGENNSIGPNTEIKDSTIGNGNVIRQSVVHDSTIEHFATIGPFAHIRPLSTISEKVKIGNFVEVKKSTMASGSKASHLSYIGDAEIGKDVNLGCGSITVNYDGVNKYKTKVEDGAFIGCNSNLIAPVTVGKNAYVAAGSTVTNDVPDESLAIARARQTTKENYAVKLKEKQQER
ncbi:bifunctional UDP-N-acetylglucosamine diphosphorylase/glucosamine-1-phosphate N-acetyltransferase GlmU [Fictibacillus sp. Mic-4]|uniref:bifunctional UDP-N-acetylglucosamine diphosphorylase/glucosamine-1-phosphate N-acetyltransferase GlmU n=1 Tax=Fictibacillus TaxID=1329200 RepID=UPI00040BAC37|nr:bifunctional UDP-N-acetylglucosamine diphosphorylase/glucosamine-1-phosphate N-acetyltransferase GlmU [Fictibacillus gelatini]